MLNLWALLLSLPCTVVFQAPAPAPPVQGPPAAPGQANPLVLPKPQGPTLAPGQAPASMPTLPTSFPALTPEQIAVRLASRLTQLATRIHSLALAANVQVPSTGP